MRSFTGFCLVSALLLQTGCASTFKLTGDRKAKLNPQAASQYVSARQMESQGKLEKARELYEQLLDKQPDNPEYLHRLGVVCTQLQRYGEANSLYERARDRDPKNVSLLSDMGYSSYLRGDLTEAEQILRQATHLKPSDKRAVTNLALVVGRQGNVEESLTLLRQAGTEASALLGLAYIRTQRGEYDLAEQQYLAALALDPNLKEATEALSELSHRKSTKQSLAVTAKPATVESVAFDDIPATKFQPSVIRQVSSSEDFSENAVVTAAFVKESSTSAAPALLEDEDSIPERISIIAKPTTTFEQTSGFDPIDDKEIATQSSPSASVESPSNDDWESDDVVTKAVPGPMASKDWANDDSAMDDEPSWTKQPTPSRNSHSDRLTFGPRKSRSLRPVAETNETPNSDFESPTNSVEFE